jgi:hypothetical protein
MASNKQKYIEDAALVLDTRAALLESTFNQKDTMQSAVSVAADLAAIAEARHCARLIRSLLQGRYAGNPYWAARERCADDSP